MFPDVGVGGLDLSFGTGRQSIWPHSAAFVVFIVRAGLLHDLRSYFERHYPDLAVNLEEVFRRAPDSYAHLSYWSQIAHRWRSLDGQSFAARFRLVPPGFQEIGQETGYPDANDRANLYDQDRHPWEVRPTDYLRTELRDRLRQETVSFDLDVQLRQDESDATLDPSHRWPEDQFPWLRVGRIELQQADAPSESERVRVDPGLLPSGLEVIAAESMTSPASLGYSRARIYKRVSAMRVAGLSAAEDLRGAVRWKESTRWAWHTFASTVVFVPLVIARRRRATHGSGVYAEGSFVPVEHGEFWPDGGIEDLVAGTALIRHANSFLGDDMGADVRGLAVAIRGVDGRSFWEFLTNTGASAEWANVPMWTERLWGMIRFRGHVYFRHHPEAVPNAVGGLRRAPTSYADLAYYSQIALRVVHPGRPARIFRMRIHREHLETESGLIPGGVHAFWPQGFDARSFPDPLYGEAFHTKRLHSEPRPKDALRREFADRLAQAPVEYLVQVQLRADEADPRHVAYNPMQTWDEQSFPWETIGRIEVHDVLAAGAPKPRGFTLAVHPSFIVLPPSTSVDDYTSLVNLRVGIYETMQRLRSALRVH